MQALRQRGAACSRGNVAQERAARPLAPAAAAAAAAVAPRREVARSSGCSSVGSSGSSFGSGVNGERHGRRCRGARLLARSTLPPGAPVESPPAPSAPVETDGVEALPVAPRVTLLRGACKGRLKYEVEYALKRGTTENSYLLAPAGEAAPARVLIDVPFQAFAEDFVACLEAQTSLANLTHIVITHMAPNRIASLSLLLEKALAARGAGAPPLQLVVSNPLIKVLQAGLAGEGAALLERVKLVPVLGEAEIDVGGGRALTAICTPTPRWPDLMVVYDPESRVAFTSKLFSAHVAPALVSAQAGAQAFDSVGGWDAYADDWRYFFDCMLAPVARQAAAALDKLPLAPAPRGALERPADFVAALSGLWTATLRGLAGVSNRYESSGAGADGGGALVAFALAPQHGPVVRAGVGRLVREYAAWAAAQVEALGRSRVAVLYASAYGNTAALAQAISAGVTKGGVAVETVNLELSSLDEVVAAVKGSDGFVIGSPTLGGHMPTQVQLALGSVLREPSTRQLPVGVFGSFGWSGEAVDEMEAKLKDGGFSFAFDSIRVKFKPSAKDLLACEQAGRDMAVQVKRRLKARERGAMGAGAAAVSANSAQLAMGRVVGSLCVVAARDEDATSAMLASWVSQASFDPPGLTVAVKKDRAMSSMLTPGNKFAMSMLSEANAKAAMKALTRPFQPGEDRLAGLATKESPASGCPFLEGASAHVDCEVVSRMDAADHWVVYAKVVGGAVDNDAVLTAVHHRKVGNHY